MQYVDVGGGPGVGPGLHRKPGQRRQLGLDPRRRRFDARRARRLAQQPQLRALAAARLGADLDAQRLSLGDPRHVRRQVERAVRPFAEVDERQRQLPLDLAHPADDHRAQRLAGDVGIPGDQQPLGPPVEGDHAARLADARIEVGPPLGHPGYPRPTSSERVS